MIRMEPKMVLIWNDAVILTEVTEERPYLIKAGCALDILDDGKGDCKTVPKNEAKVYFASFDGRRVDPWEYKDFGSLMAYLEGLPQAQGN